MKARYLVGRQARGMLLAKRLLPDLVFDRVARRALESERRQDGGG